MRASIKLKAALLARQGGKRRTYSPNHALYADRKQQWINANPDASAADYERAMHRIAKECGV